VDWFPWGKEAFEKAKAENKPVLMSVGYATCHWCHVMEEESFEDLEIAEFMSKNFVCVKVDREERPDVDNIYMSSVYMLHGRGGWPMTVIMTADKAPFFAGTYFPPRTGVRGSRKGFREILSELSEQYKSNPDSLVTKAKEISQRIANQSRATPAEGVPEISALSRSAQRFLQMHDRTWGGFGRAPKFPRPVTLDMMLRHYRRNDDRPALDAVSLTLNKMADGGMYDQVGGGFHRYSVDGRWLVPHFEKMLYDNGQLAVTFLDAYQITKNERFATIAREVLDYVLREMRDPTGAFWSATDADSEGEEGTFFVWKPSQLIKVLGEKRANIATKYWGVSGRGNFEHGTSILHLSRPADDVAKELGISTKVLLAEIDTAKKQLYEHRLSRIPPLTDDKVLTAWNGLMISGMARGSFVLGTDKYIKKARIAADFILKHMRTSGRLLRTFRVGKAKYTAYLSDYAFLGQGLLDLFEATNEIRWLTEAIALHETLEKHYADTKAGGYFQTAHDAEKLLARDKPDYDGAEPSGNSIIARNLLRLNEYTGNAQYKQRAENIFKWSARTIERRGPAIPAMLSALDMYHSSARQVILVTAPNDLNRELALRKTIREQYLPNRMLVVVKHQEVEKLAKQIPYVSKKVARNGQTTAYVCELGVCKKPTSDPKELAALLAAKTL